jgi:hypothetical protein
VSPSCSRKSFFVKLGGLLAAVGIAPALFAKSAVAATIAAPPVVIRPDQRAVPRKEGSC